VKPKGAKTYITKMRYRPHLLETRKQQYHHSSNLKKLSRGEKERRRRIVAKSKNAGQQHLENFYNQTMRKEATHSQEKNGTRSKG
jgi:hypothetical protein